jgi:hypothetical protein
VLAYFKHLQDQLFFDFDSLRPDFLGDIELLEKPHLMEVLGGSSNHLVGVPEYLDGAKLIGFQIPAGTWRFTEKFLQAHGTDSTEELRVRLGHTMFGTQDIQMRSESAPVIRFSSSPLKEHSHP